MATLTIAQGLAPVRLPRTTIPPPSSGVYPAAYPLFAMVTETFDLDDVSVVGSSVANDGLATDVDELRAMSGDDVHSRPTERP